MVVNIYSTRCSIIPHTISHSIGSHTHANMTTNCHIHHPPTTNAIGTRTLPTQLKLNSHRFGSQPCHICERCAPAHIDSIDINRHKSTIYFHWKRDRAAKVLFFLFICCNNLSSASSRRSLKHAVLSIRSHKIHNKTDKKHIIWNSGIMKKSDDNAD